MRTRAGGLASQPLTVIDPKTTLAAALLLMIAPGCAPAGAPARAGRPPRPDDLLELARLKDFEAFRASSNNADLESNDDSKRPIPGETVVLADLKGPGVVTHIWLTVAANEYAWPRLLRLRVYYDGSKTPSIDAPIGDFFGVGHGLERPVSSLLVRNGSSGRSRNSYWPMPFKESCRITVTNEGRRRVSNLYYHVDYRRVKALPADVGYLHAHYRQALPAPAGTPYEVLSVRGRGHYVGTVFSVIQNQAGWFGEGDDFFYIDGNARASIEGTGTEDYFNDAWTLRVAEGAYTGVPVADGTGLGSRMTAYRWHTADPIPFTRSLRFDFEHAGWTYELDGSVRSAFEERADLFSSVAFWYHDGVARGLPEPPYGTARLPHGNARQIEAESRIQDVRTVGGKAEVQKEVFWSRDLLFFHSVAPGSKIDVPFDVDEEGDYELLAQVAHNVDYGTYGVLLDDKPLGPITAMEHEPGANLGGESTIDAYYSEIYVAEDHLLGRAKLSRGRHVLTFVCTGKNAQSTGYHLGIDTLILARIGKPEPMGGPRAAEMRRLGALGNASGAATLRGGLSDPDPEVRAAAAWAFTQMGASASGAAQDLAGALGDRDAVVRGLALVALRNAGRAAAPVLGQITARLSDGDVAVRMMAAEAIAAQGSGAAPALGPLIEAAKAEDEHPHVQRSLAAALGAIGPAAAPALPALERFERIPRVRWAARAAMRKIRAHP